MALQDKELEENIIIQRKCLGQEGGGSGQVDTFSVSLTEILEGASSVADVKYLIVHCQPNQLFDSVSQLCQPSTSNY